MIGSESAVILSHPSLRPFGHLYGMLHFGRLGEVLF